LGRREDSRTADVPHLQNSSPVISSHEVIRLSFERHGQEEGIIGVICFRQMVQSIQNNCPT